MKEAIAVIGNSYFNIGHAVAADLSLAGHRVRFMDWTDHNDTLSILKSQGGFEVVGNVQELVSRKTGFAKPELITSEVSRALDGAGVVFLDLHPSEFQIRFEALLPHLRDGQIVHFNSHGYWPSLQVAGLLRDAGLMGVTLSEGPAPMIAAESNRGKIIPNKLRRKLPVACFPASRQNDFFPRLKAIYPTLVPAENVLQTNLESINLLIHPAITLLNIAYFDRMMIKGQKIDFYATGSTIHTGLLAEAQDRERMSICQAYNLSYIPLQEHIIRYYNSKGDSVFKTVKNCGFYQNVPSMPADFWMNWMKTDTHFLITPTVAIANLAEVEVPLHRAMIAIADALLKEDFLSNGLNLKKLGLNGLDVAGVMRYVQTGDK